MNLTKFWQLIEEYPWLCKVIGINDIAQNFDPDDSSGMHAIEFGARLSGCRKRIEYIAFRPPESLDLDTTSWQEVQERTLTAAEQSEFAPDEQDRSIYQEYGDGDPTPEAIKTTRGTDVLVYWHPVYTLMFARETRVPHDKSLREVLRELYAEHNVSQVDAIVLHHTKRGDCSTSSTANDCRHSFDVYYTPFAPKKG